MDCNEYINKYKEIQSKINEFIDNDENSDENFNSLQVLFNEKNIQNDKYDLKLLFHLLIKIANNHHRGASFFDKIDKILSIFKDDIKKYFSNAEIFNIFKGNKRILLFFCEHKMIIFDKSIVQTITSSNKYIRNNYPCYFAPEIKPFIKEDWFPKYAKNNSNLSKNAFVEEIMKELPENFYENRKKGENDGYICEIIRNDSIEEFIQYINKNNCSLASKINRSIYETSSYLLKYLHGFIEYAAYFGSVQIFHYLLTNNVEMDISLTAFAIHGNNAEIIHLLEDRLGKTCEVIYKNFFKESIKCHHNNIADYYKNFIEQDEDFKDVVNAIALKHYNFSLVSNIENKQTFFGEFCKYDYFLLAKNSLNNIDINEIKIL